MLHYMILEGPHYQIHYTEVEPEPVASKDGWRDIDIRFLIGAATTGTHDVTLWRARFAPGAAHSRHTHDVGEAFFVVSGRGAAGTGDKEYEVAAGSGLYVPPGAVHWFRNPDETEPVEIIGVYAPAGSLKESGYRYVGEITDEYRQV
jgi:mannose-6-phosphate isomerase-like protein (cupin superfamily)